MNNQVGLKSGIENRLYRATIAGLLGILPMFTAEILNGMEMSMFAFLLVAFVLAFEKKSR